MSIINTNTASLTGQANLRNSQSSLATVMERLSSGMRINSAKDDAAGQAIANRMTAQINGLAQAQRNANDGISIAQTAEGALDQVNDNLQRIRELTVQSLNATNSSDDLISIHAEINQRESEIDRISSETDFNGVKVLSQNRILNMQVGANDGEVIGIDLQQINVDALGLNKSFVNGPRLDSNGEGMVIEDALSEKFGNSKFTSVGFTSVSGSVPLGPDWQGLLNLSNAVGVYDLEIIADLNGNFFIEDNIVVTGGDIAKVEAKGFQGFVDASGGGNFKVYVPANFERTTENGSVLEFTFDATDYQTDDVTQAATNQPLALIDEAINQVDIFRSELGAVQNRFESAIENLSTNETNLSAARSRIEDADYAVEVANMTRAQILQQAGTSVLAQANQIPQNVLSLLG